MCLLHSPSYNPIPKCISVSEEQWRWNRAKISLQTSSRHDTIDSTRDRKTWSVGRAGQNIIALSIPLHYFFCIKTWNHHSYNHNWPIYYAVPNNMVTCIFLFSPVSKITKLLNWFSNHREWFLEEREVFLLRHESMIYFNYCEFLKLGFNLSIITQIHVWLDHSWLCYLCSVTRKGIVREQDRINLECLCSHIMKNHS